MKEKTNDQFKNYIISLSKAILSSVIVSTIISLTSSAILLSFSSPTISFAIKISSMPFCAYTSNGISVYSVLYSSLMIPVIGIITGSVPYFCHLDLNLFG